MIWPPEVYDIAELLDLDPGEVARWSPRRVNATLHWCKWRRLQEARAREEAKQEADIQSARNEARNRSGKRPPVPKK